MSDDKRDEHDKRDATPLLRAGFKNNTMQMRVVFPQDTPRIIRSDPVLWGIIEDWFDAVEASPDDTRFRECFLCGDKLPETGSPPVNPAAFLVFSTPNFPGQAGVTGLCAKCGVGSSQEVAERVAEKVTGGKDGILALRPAPPMEPAPESSGTVH